jgi:hypothetical protein
MGITDNVNWNFWMVFIFTYLNVLLLYYLVYINPNLIEVNLDRVTGLRINTGVLNALFVLFLFIIINLTYNLIIKVSEQYNDKSDFKYLQEIIKYLKQALSGYITGVMVVDTFIYTATKTQELFTTLTDPTYTYTLIPNRYDEEEMQVVGTKTILGRKVPVVIPKSVDPSTLLAPSFNSPLERYGFTYIPVTLFIMLMTYWRCGRQLSTNHFIVILINSYMTYANWLFFWRMEITSYIDSFTTHSIAVAGMYYFMRNSPWFLRQINLQPNQLRHPFGVPFQWRRRTPLYIFGMATFFFQILVHVYLLYLYSGQITFDLQVLRYYLNNYVWPNINSMPLPIALFVLTR